MSCGGGCCQRKNYNSDKPLSKRIPQVILVFFVVWLIGFGYLAQAFNQPSKPRNKRRKNKRRYNHKQGFFERFVDGIRHSSGLIWILVFLIIVSLFYLFIRVIRLQARKLESHIQDKWEEAMAEQQRRYQERRGNYSSGYDYDEDYDEDYNGPRIRELETEEEEAHWRSLIEKEKRERERQIAAAAAEEEEEKKKYK